MTMMVFLALIMIVMIAIKKIMVMEILMISMTLKTSIKSKIYHLHVKLLDLMIAMRGKIMMVLMMTLD